MPCHHLSTSNFRKFIPYFLCIKSLSHIQQLHALLLINGLHKSLLYGSKITHAYIQLGSLQFASKAFRRITSKNLRSWNTILSGYSSYSSHHQVLRFYSEMLSEGYVSDSFSLVYAIKACIALSLLYNGKSFHCLAIKSGLENDQYVMPQLMVMYTDLGFLDYALKLFEQIPKKSSVIWGVLIKGYLKFSKESRVFELLYDMRNSGFEWDAFTIEGLVRACANISAGREGKAAHGVCIKNNLLDFNVCLRTSLVHMYMKCGFLHFAVRLFQEVEDKDVVLWSAVIDGHVKNGKGLEAISLFRNMLGNLITPNSVALNSIILACSSVGCLKQGKSTHCFAVRRMVDLDVINYTSLIDMHVKCGSVEMAYRIFSMMPEKTVVSWSAMINGFGVHGLYSRAVATFDQMITEKMTPNSITFVSVLSACSHSGMVEDGWRFLKSMTQDYGILPEEEHYACMIDLLGRAGQIDEALSLITNMPTKPGASAWGALLSACRIHKRAELAKEVANNLLLVEPDESSVYVLLSNVYADAGMWELVKKTRMKISEQGFRNSFGFTSIEVNSKLYLFHSEYELAYWETQVEQIWSTLAKEMKENG